MGAVFALIIIYVAIIAVIARASIADIKKRRDDSQTGIDSSAAEEQESFDSKESVDIINSRMNKSWNSMIYGEPEVVPVGTHRSDLAVIDERLLHVKSRLPEEIERRENELALHRWTMENLQQEQIDIARETRDSIRAEQRRQQARFTAWALRTMHK